MVQHFKSVPGDQIIGIEEGRESWEKKVYGVKK
jgi:hypothetical protein